MYDIHYKNSNLLSWDKLQSHEIYMSFGEKKIKISTKYKK